ncbi:anti-sigma factor antagonist [Spirochaetia bacterium]|nr:anti-sigma factor antagonist [Spirochaetia bacterium]
MEITTIKQDGTMTLNLAGKITALETDDFGAACETAVDEGVDLTLNFNDVTYIASAGLRVIMSAKKRQNTKKLKLSLINMKPEVLEVFKMTGLDEIFNINQ